MKYNHRAPSEHDLVGKRDDCTEECLQTLKQRQDKQELQQLFDSGHHDPPLPGCCRLLLLLPLPPTGALFLSWLSPSLTL